MLYHMIHIYYKLALPRHTVIAHIINISMTTTKTGDLGTVRLDSYLDSPEFAIATPVSRLLMRLSLTIRRDFIARHFDAFGRIISADYYALSSHRVSKWGLRSKSKLLIRSSQKLAFVRIISMVRFSIQG